MFFLQNGNGDFANSAIALGGNSPAGVPVAALFPRPLQVMGPVMAAQTLACGGSPGAAVSGSLGQGAAAAPLGRLLCPSEALVAVRSSAGGTAAVSAAQAAVARSMVDRDLARRLADAERRIAFVHRGARDVFSQAAAEALQQGLRPWTLLQMVAWRAQQGRMSRL